MLQPCMINDLSITIKYIFMPSQINLQITGRIQNIVFYKRGDKYYARTVSGNIRQTKATKKRATEFGKASGAGKVLRHQLIPVIPFPSDNKMQTRLVSELFSWFRANVNPEEPVNPGPYLDGFGFTDGSGVSDRWHVTLEVTKAADDILEIKIPAFVPAKNLSAPAGTVSVKCNIATGGYQLKNGGGTGGFSTTIHFNYTGEIIPAQTVSLPTPAPSGSLVVVGISLEYYFIKNGHLQKTKNKAFMPAGIVKAICF